jgi:hypothetical protein
MKSSNVVKLNTVYNMGVQTSNNTSNVNHTVGSGLSISPVGNQIVIGDPIPAQSTHIIPGYIDWDPRWTPEIVPWYPNQLSNSFLTVEPSPWRTQFLHDRLVLSTDVPGVDPSGLKVEIENNSLKATGVRSDTSSPVNVLWFLTSDYDSKTAQAEVSLGVLKVVIMKFQERKTIQVPVVVK